MHDFVFLKINGDNWKIHYSDMVYIEAVDKYVKIITSSKPFLVLSSLCQVDKLLPRDLFCRIHRSYIVSLQHTSRFNSDMVYVGGKTLPIGKNYKGCLDNKVTLWCAKYGSLGGVDSVDKLIENL